MTLAEQYLDVKRKLFDKYYSFLNDEQRRAVFKTELERILVARNSRTSSGSQVLVRMLCRHIRKITIRASNSGIPIWQMTPDSKRVVRRLSISAISQG